MSPLPVHHSHSVSASHLQNQPVPFKASNAQEGDVDPGKSGLSELGNYSNSRIAKRKLSQTSADSTESSAAQAYDVSGHLGKAIAAMRI